MIVITLTFIFASMVSIVSVTNIYLNETQKAKESVYGSFTDIIYKEHTNEDFDLNERYGRFYISKLQNDGQSVTYIGVLNDKAKILSKLKIKNISLQENEVIVTRSFAKEKELNKQDKLVIKGYSLVVKDIIDDYGMLWVKGEEEVRKGYHEPNVLVSPNVFSELKSSIVFSVTLEKFNGQPSEQWLDLEGNHYHNMFIDKQNTTAIYYFPSFFEKLLSIIFSFIVFTLIKVYQSSARKKYHVYDLMGMNTKYIGMTCVIETIYMVCLAMVLGLTFSFVFSSCLLSLVFKKVFFVPVDYLIIYIGKYMILMSIMCLFSFLFLPIFTKKERRVKRQSHQFFFIKGTKRYMVFAGMFSILLVFLVSLMTTYFQAVNKGVLSSDAYGKMTDHFDYEFSIKKQNNIVNKTYYHQEWHEASQHSDWILQYYRDTGELEKLAKNIKSSFPNAQEDIYQELSSVYLVNKDNVFNQPYIERLYVDKVLENNPFFTSLLDEDRKILRISLITYPDDTIKELSSFFNKEVDVDSVLSGEEALVVAPAYEYFEERIKDGNIVNRFSKPIDATHSNATLDTKISKESILETVFLSSSSSVYGRLSTQEAKDIFKVHKVPITVAGVVYRQIGWFTLEEMSAPYRLIVSHAFMEKHHLPQYMTRLRVRIPDKEYEHVNSQIRNFMSGYKDIDFIDQFEKLKIFKEYSILQQSFNILIVIMFVTLITLILNSFIQSFFIHHQQRYSIYVLLGLSDKKLMMICFLPMCLSILLSSIITFGLVLFLTAGPVVWWTVKMMLEFVWNVGIPYLVIIVILWIITWIQTKRFMKQVHTYYSE
ncbi:hypothetical protein KG091_02255 [Carnobacteriaceae bacterium zg-ZUI78]|nr:hypothetical protein [Carnobacteriaceae bacterium zg-ZUI78]